MWWQDAITVAVVCLVMVSLITALVAGVLVLEPSMAVHCDQCGHAMIDTHPDQTPICLYCRYGHPRLRDHGHSDRADRELTTAASRGV